MHFVDVGIIFDNLIYFYTITQNTQLNILEINFHTLFFNICEQIGIFLENIVKYSGFKNIGLVQRY